MNPTTAPMDKAQILLKPKDRPKKRYPAISALDKAFSLYVRKRDSMAFNGLAFRCITCRQVKPYEQADAGHYLGRQFWATRWNPVNVQSQCRYDNRFNEGLKSSFRDALIEKVGLGEVMKLEAMHKQGRKPKDFERAEILARIKADMAVLG